MEGSGILLPMVALLVAEVIHEPNETLMSRCGRSRSGDIKDSVGNSGSGRSHGTCGSRARGGIWLWRGVAFYCLWLHCW